MGFALISKSAGRAYVAFRAQPRAVLLAVFLFVLVLVTCVLLAEFVIYVWDPAEPVRRIASSLSTGLSYNWFLIGLVRYFLALLNEQPVRLARLFLGWPGFIPLLLLNLVQGLILGALFLPGFFLTTRLTGSFLGPLLFFMAVPAVFFLTIKLNFAFVFVIDRRLDLFDALLKAFQATAGSFWSVTLLLILCGLIAAAGLLVLGIGFLASGGFALLLYLAAYENLAGEIPARKSR